MFAAPAAFAQISGDSAFVTWTCTSSPCPWGPTDSGQALVWPADAGAIAIRLGYTVSGGVYLPAAKANGATIRITSGSATLYAGLPQAPSHHAIASPAPGALYTVTGVADGEVLSVQSGSSFSYEIVLPSGDGGGPDDSTFSQGVSWFCTGSSCPWGPSDSGQAVVWPSDTGGLDFRLGYHTTQPVYLPWGRANGATVAITSGSATLYAGLPFGASHRVLAALGAGQSYDVSGLATGEVLSVQSPQTFAYRVTLPPPTVEGDPSQIIHSTPALWRCNTPGCSDSDWTGSVIPWDSTSAYSMNARSGSQSRTVHDADTEDILYPYMGPWANGCEVTARSGIVLIIEWERGTDTWRETLLSPGLTHVIALTAPENGAMIETDASSLPFSVSLRNCTPQPLQ